MDHEQAISSGMFYIKHQKVYLPETLAGNNFAHRPILFFVWLSVAAAPWFWISWARVQDRATDCARSEKFSQQARAEAVQLRAEAGRMNAQSRQILAEAKETLKKAKEIQGEARRHSEQK